MFPSTYTYTYSCVLSLLLVLIFVRLSVGVYNICCVSNLFINLNGRIDYNVLFLLFHYMKKQMSSPALASLMRPTGVSE
jgi:hypothetical protein